MSWQAYRVAFRLVSPLHVGWGKVGNLQRTRPYLTGRTLWGALTAHLTRLEAADQSRPADATEYQKVGQRLHQHLSFTYFFPAVKLKPGAHPDLPSNWLVIDDFWVCTPVANDELSGHLFLDSYASTALNYEWMNALEGSLHEVEMIRPRTRPLVHTCLKGLAADESADDLGAPVYLLGYFFVNENALDDWDAALHRLQLGGERGYGWGRMELVGKPSQANDAFGCELALKEKHPTVTILSGKVLLAHALAFDFKDEENRRKIVRRAVSRVAGIVEPLVGRETRADGCFGVHVSEARICWMPGSGVTAETTVQIGPYGIWQAK